MRIWRWLGLLALWVCVGLALVWSETRDLRIRQRVSQLHQQRRQLMEQRARLLAAAHRRLSPPRLAEAVERLELGLLPPEELSADQASSPQPLRP